MNHTPFTLIVAVILVFKFSNQNDQAGPLTIHRCADFPVTGQGSSAEWVKAEWMFFTKLDSGGTAYETKCKMLYSTTGIYVLFTAQDNKITTKDYNDFESIFNGDVFEIFFHPSGHDTVYFEYEINALSKELILTLTKQNGKQYSWAPRYPSAEARKPIVKRVSVEGGDALAGNLVRKWTAEIYIPYSMLALLRGVPPQSGTIWNANFCRLDYDSGEMIKYSWSPAIQKSFHELDRFRSIRFE